jgi:hypothetical protein
VDDDSNKTKKEKAGDEMMRLKERETDRERQKERERER